MNKLYVIRFKLPNGYIVSAWHTWSRQDAEQKMRMNPEWTFSLMENNETHMIWDAH